ncbi:extracellular signal-regulated kinase 2-like [Ptychodera flava]|uniref:extracellular signal-regulated kinase 2-like n=1 Tax=Ptychodera flava TaxID=63121 RepID=UPI00396A50F0
MTSEVEEHILRKYEIKTRLGKGAYGIVWKAIDRKTGELVAVKKVFDAFRNRTDAQRTFREIMFLQEFGDHPNIVKLHNVIKAENDRDIYLIFEFMDIDLHVVIKKGNILEDIQKRYIMYQVLKAIKYLHSGNVIHRDMKPSNILLDKDCFVKVADFGLARSLHQLEDMDTSANPELTDYVATRWYRSPEILLASKRYTKGADMWSIGCILGEMLLGRPLFAGSSSFNQVEKILSAIPKPSHQDILAIQSQYAQAVIDKNVVRHRRDLEDMIPTAPSDAMDLLKRLLQFNPDKRISVEEALRHPYVARFCNPSKEIILDYDVVPPLDDDILLTVNEYRDKLYELIKEKKSKIRRQKKEVIEKHRQFQEQQQQEEVKQKSPRKPETRQERSPRLQAADAVTVSNDGDGKVKQKQTSDDGTQQNQFYGVAFGRTTKTPPPQVNPQAQPPRHKSTFTSSMRDARTQITRDVEKSPGRPLSAVRATPEPRKPVAAEPRTCVSYGRKQFHGRANMETAGTPTVKATMGSYTQSHGTITATALANIKKM